MRRQRSRNLVAVTATMPPELLARLEARAALQGLSRAQVLRSLVEALPEPSPQPPRVRRAGEA